MSVSDIIAKAGGRELVAQRVEKTEWAIKKWERNGIPDRHWPVLIEMSGDTLTPDDLYRANREAREVAA